ncbi:MAG TPA: zf-HC2 domain-containing protein [Vicinamibacteria bacterium]|jgi:predicted anti-sigma-YlaC factor YlaD
MISCNEVLAELSDYLDNDLTPEFRKALEAHLSHCRTCQVIYDSMHKSLRLVTESSTFELPEGITQGIMTKIRARLRPNLDPEKP